MAATRPRVGPSRRQRKGYQDVTPRELQGSSTRADCDVFVIGGGPAGSTIAALLAERGHRVILAEKDRHPRFHIGESLLPHNLPLFDRLGVRQEIEWTSMPKHGIEFVLPYHGKSVTYYFARALDRRFPIPSRCGGPPSTTSSEERRGQGGRSHQGCRIIRSPFRGRRPRIDGRDGEGASAAGPRPSLSMPRAAIRCWQHSLASRNAIAGTTVRRSSPFHGRAAPAGKAQGNLSVVCFDMAGSVHPARRRRNECRRRLPGRFFQEPRHRSRFLLHERHRLVPNREPSHGCAARRPSRRPATICMARSGRAARSRSRSATPAIHRPGLLLGRVSRDTMAFRGAERSRPASATRAGHRVRSSATMPRRGARPARSSGSFTASASRPCATSSCRRATGSESRRRFWHCLPASLAAGGRSARAS